MTEQDVEALAERLEGGAIERPKRWSGDTHDDLGGSVDCDATDTMMAEAAATLRALSAALENAVAEAHATGAERARWKARAEKAESAARTAYARGIEDAAKECDRLAGDPAMYGAERRRAAGQCSAAIRALAPDPEER